MNSKQPSHPDLLEGEILFCYATEDEFASIGIALREKLRKGSHVPENFRPGRGRRQEEYAPYFAKIADLDGETLARLGYRPPEKVNWEKRIMAWERFSGTDGLVHTSHGYLDPSDRNQRAMMDP